jgi:hypothetical protein
VGWKRSRRVGRIGGVRGGGGGLLGATVGRGERTEGICAPGWEVFPSHRLPFTFFLFILVFFIAIVRLTLSDNPRYSTEPPLFRSLRFIRRPEKEAREVVVVGLRGVDEGDAGEGWVVVEWGGDEEEGIGGEEGVENEGKVRRWRRNGG